ncbi:hypothetical protein BCR39DRAFT_549475 [Naematelia encephala]|uniref:PINIT domain-domain-containing protein n=1 Tax=Naematelia encephala TaxID=71784 RepID=A0A1Y2ALI2_9TREE|nr:hypothetical protein BCR39DRAFT_549475 [Naematelia encephala]
MSGGYVTNFDDFDWFINVWIPKQTVPNLRSMASHVQTGSGVPIYFRSAEKKAEVVDKIRGGFMRMRQNGDLLSYGKARHSCETIGQPQRNYNYMPAPTFGGVPASSAGAARYGGMGSSAGSYGSPSYASAGPSRTSGSGWATTPAASSIYSGPGHVLQDWKPSPMWKPIKAMTSMEMLPHIETTENSHSRKDRRVTFTQTQDMIDKLTQTKNDPKTRPHYSLRLFCTSNDHYRPTNTPMTSSNMHVTNKSIPIEYPSNPDAAIDDQVLHFKEKGLRGKPGSAPPFDLSRSQRGLNLAAGRLMTIVMGHTGPTTGKKKEIAKRFWFQVVLAEITTKEELLETLKSKAITPPQEALAMTKDDDDEDEIIVGSTLMSLRDPLSYTRITCPIRSSKCRHIQCFDATWWIESNVNHPQWLCPKCHKELVFDDLIVDGYFLEILKACPDDVDEVIIESDGQWHTEDKKYGSSEWMAQNGAIPPPPPIAPPEPPVDIKPATLPTPLSEPQKSESPETKGKRRAIEVSDDSDDDEAPLAKVPRPSLPRPTPSSLSVSRPPSVQPASNAVIDLTLDSDEEDDGPPAAPPDPDFRRPSVGSTSRDASDSRAPLATDRDSSYRSASNEGGVTARPTSNGGNRGGLFGENGGTAFGRSSVRSAFGPGSIYESGNSEWRPGRADSWRPWNEYQSDRPQDLGPAVPKQRDPQVPPPHSWQSPDEDEERYGWQSRQRGEYY